MYSGHYTIGVRSWTWYAKSDQRFRLESARGNGSFNMFEIGDTSGNTYLYVNPSGVFYAKDTSGTFQTMGGTGGTSGVSSLNSLSGALSLIGGSGIAITPSGNTITIAATGGGSGVSSVNSATGALTIAGGANVAVSTSGSTITIAAVNGTNGVTALNSQTGSISLIAGSGVSITSSSGSITISSSGAGGYVGGTGVSISGSTISIGQAVGTSNAVSFYSITTTAGMQINQSGGYGLYLPNSYVYSNGINSFNNQWNGIQSSGGVAAASGFYLASGATMINSSGQFVGNGVSCPSYGVQAAGFNPTGYTGQSATAVFSGGFQVNGVNYTQLKFVGGAFVGAA
jgi:hypothetical protein